jgi:secondary thiamine-phosphate synthase enzyme
MRQAVHEFTVPTRGKGMYEFTREVRVWIEASGIQTGLLTLHVRHTSASILVQENADPQVQADFEAYMSRLVRDGDAIFEHTVEGPDDMAAHVRAALTSTTLSIPVVGGVLVLGTWQGIFLYEHRLAPNRRKVAAHLLGE